MDANTPISVRAAASDHAPLDKATRSPEAPMPRKKTIIIKLVVIVDDDIGVFDEPDALWAMATRVQADRDLFVIRESLGAILDPSASPEGLTAKLGVDATRS